MSAPEAIQGLNCPNCGGMVPVPEGQRIVRCPYCEQRSWVRGERGVQRFQVQQQVDRGRAEQALKGYLGGNLSIARDAARRAEINEAFLAYLPFWSVWGRAAGWVFGEDRVSSGKNTRYVPREVRLVEDLSWNGAASDMGEFGVQRIGLSGRPLETYNLGEMQMRGMVFEPSGSFGQAQERAAADFESTLRSRSKLERISQAFVRLLRRQAGLVYYPLWVLRYLYRGRSFQVVVDAHSGDVLYAKAPGNTLFRAAVLVGGMALGAFLMIDLPAIILWFLANSRDSNDLIWAALVAFIAGVGVMGAAHTRFRYGEQVEYRKIPEPAAGPAGDPLEFIVDGLDSEPIREALKWIDRSNLLR